MFWFKLMLNTTNLIEHNIEYIRVGLKGNKAFYVAQNSSLTWSISDFMA